MSWEATLRTMEVMKKLGTFKFEDLEREIRFPDRNGRLAAEIDTYTLYRAGALEMVDRGVYRITDKFDEVLRIVRRRASVETKLREALSRPVFFRD